MSLIRKLWFEAESKAKANGPVATHPTIRKFLRRKIIRVLLLLLMITTTTIPCATSCCPVGQNPPQSNRYSNAHVRGC